MLRTFRANPARSAETLQIVAEALQGLGASYLLTIGGDDTVSGAAARRSHRTTAPADRPEQIYSARQKQSGRHLGASGTSGRAGASGGGVNGAHTAAADG